MDNLQAIFLAKKFLNLDISYCDPEMWYNYMIDKCELAGTINSKKYINALDALILLNKNSDKLDSFYEYIERTHILNEVYDLLHAIPDDPTPVQYEIFHWIESKHI